MSKEMQILFQRMQRFKPATEEPPKPSAALRSLWSRLETRWWQEDALLELEFLIYELDAELGLNEHVKTCERCQIELQLSVERYLGSRGPWWINLQNGDCLSEYYPGCPKVENYRIGSEDETLRFIKDRLDWATKIMEKQFKAACKLVKILENWPTSRGIPKVSWVSGMADEIAGLPLSFFGVYDD